jgi:hypothetical protein
MTASTSAPSARTAPAHVSRPATGRRERPFHAAERRCHTFPRGAPKRMRPPGGRRAQRPNRERGFAVQTWPMGGSARADRNDSHGALRRPIRGVPHKPRGAAERWGDRCRGVKLNGRARAAGASFGRSPREHVCRVVPQRLGIGIAEVAATEPDISEHTIIKGRQAHSLAPVTKPASNRPQTADHPTPEGSQCAPRRSGGGDR